MPPSAPSASGLSIGVIVGIAIRQPLQAARVQRGREKKIECYCSFKEFIASRKLKNNLKCQLRYLAMLISEHGFEDGGMLSICRAVPPDSSFCSPYQHTHHRS